MGRVKVTGYRETDGLKLDPSHATGLSEDDYEALTEEFLGLEDVDFQVVDD